MGFSISGEIKIRVSGEKTPMVVPIGKSPTPKPAADGLKLSAKAKEATKKQAPEAPAPEATPKPTMLDKPRKARNK